MKTLQLCNKRQKGALICYLNSPLYLEDERRITSQLHRLREGDSVDFDWLYDSLADAARRGIVTFYNTFGEEVNNPSVLFELKKAYKKCDDSFKPSSLRQFVRHCRRNIDVDYAESKAEKECIGIRDIEKYSSTGFSSMFGFNLENYKDFDLSYDAIFWEF